MAIIRYRHIGSTTASTIEKISAVMTGAPYVNPTHVSERPKETIAPMAHDQERTFSIGSLLAKNMAQQAPDASKVTNIGQIKPENPETKARIIQITRALPRQSTSSFLIAGLRRVWMDCRNVEFNGVLRINERLFRCWGYSSARADFFTRPEWGVLAHP